MELFSQTAQMVAILWGWGFGELHAHSAPSNCCFQSHCGAGKRGWHSSKFKSNKDHCSQIQLFFLNKCSLDCCKPLVNFRVLEKLILTILASVLFTFMEERFLLHHCRGAYPSQGFLHLMFLLPGTISSSEASFFLSGLSLPQVSVTREAISEYPISSSHPAP